MRQLTKIVLVDSLCDGLIAELRMDGNTSLNGTNAIGKTSFLKLIPIFFGASPGSVVRAGGNRVSFADWYLPRRSSYVIFEYQVGASDFRCALLHRSSSGYAYRFVRATWSQDLILRNAESGDVVPGAEIQEHLRRCSIECTPELSSLHYKKIIQNNTNAGLEDIHDSMVVKLIRNLRPTFSLAQPHTSLHAIDHVIFAMLESKGDFNSMRGTMAGILSQENELRSDGLTALTKRTLDDLIEGYKSYLKVEELRPKFELLAEQAYRYAAATRQLGIQKHRAGSLVHELTEQFKLLDEQLLKVNEDLTAHEQTYSAARQKHSKVSSEVEGKLIQANEDVERLERQQAEHSRRGASELCDLVNKVPMLKAQVSERGQHLENLTSKVKSIDGIYSDRIAQLERDAAQAINHQNKRKDVANGAYHHRIGELLHRQSNEKKSLTKKQELEREALALRINDAKEIAGKQQGIYASLNSFSVLPAAQADLNLAQARVDEQRDVCKAASEVMDKARISLEARSDDRDDAARRYQALQDRKAQAETCKRELASLSKAHPDSLLTFLRTHHPEWTSHIAKLVPADILMRTDLAPVMVQAASDLYGVGLELGSIDSPLVADEERILAAIIEAEKSIQDIALDMEALTAEARELENAHRSAVILHGESAKKSTEAISELEARISAFDGLFDRAVADCKAHLASLKVAENEALETVARLVQSESDLKAAHGRDLLALTTSAEIELDDLKVSLQQEIAQIEGIIEEVVSALQVNRETVERDRLRAYEKEGLNTAEIGRIQREIGELNLQLRKANDVEGYVREYQAWLSYEWPKLGEWQARLQRLEIERESLVREWSVADAQLKARQGDISKLRSRLIGEMSENSDAKQSMEGAIKLLAWLSAIDDGQSIPGLKVSDVQDEIHKQTRRRTDLQRIGSDACREIRRIFAGEGARQGTHSMFIDEIWREATSQAGNDVDEAWLYAADLFMDYLGRGHSASKGRLIIEAQGIASELADGRARLSTLDTAIKKLGTNATQKAKQVLSGFPQIQNFEFLVTSRVQKLGFWHDLTDFDKQAKIWSLMESGTLPTEDLINAIARIAKHIAEGVFAANLEECFDVAVSVNDQGHQKVARTDKELADISSNGLTTVIVTMIYISLFELLRGDADVQIIAPMDEALKFDAPVYIAIVKYLNNRKVHMMAAFPGGAPELLRQFPNRYMFQKAKGYGSKGETILVKSFSASVDKELAALEAALEADMGVV
ncbi:ATP-binding protein [Pseudomonas aeruginosa]